MAKIASILSAQFIIFYLIVSITAEKDDSFARTLDRKLFGLKREKLSHFRFYWHDVVGGKNPTAVQIIAPVSNTSTTLFGLVRMIDNPLTAGPDLRSKLWGKAQGFYASTSQTPGDFDLLMAMNFAFVSGKYNGSTLTIFGRNSVMKKVREMPVIGGSGLFRFARGYAEARTIKLDASTGDAVIEYNLYVLHY